MAMFKTADWTQPQTGGLLNEAINKEERQLRVKKGPHHTKNIWEPEHLAHRETTWNQIKPRLGQETPNQTTATRVYGSTMNKQPVRYCRSAMQHQREMTANLQALQRAGQLQSFSAEEYSTMHPTYGAHESVYSTDTTSELVGIGVDHVNHQRPTFGRENMRKDLYVSSRNGPERRQMENLSAKMWSQSKNT